MQFKAQQKIQHLVLPVKQELLNWIQNNFRALPNLIPVIQKPQKIGYDQKQINIDQQNQIKAIKQSQQQIRQLTQQFQPLSKNLINLHKQRAKSAVLKQLSFEGQDPNPSKLVNRPAKGVVWGLGGQLILADRKVQLQGIRDDSEEIIKFLELHQIKNIYIHDWHKAEEPDMNRRRYSIIGSCFSARHCWKTAIQLKNAFNRHMLNQKRNSKNKMDAITALMTGRKNQQWTLVEYKDYQVSLMTQQQRQAADLQWKWNNPPAQQTVEKNYRMSIEKKKRRGTFGDFD